MFVASATSAEDSRNAATRHRRESPQQCCAAAERGTEWYRHKSHLQHIALQCENLTRGREICYLQLALANSTLLVL